MHARNRITVPRGIVEGHPAARSGASCSTIFERRSQSRWHEPTLSAARGAEIGCAPGKNNPKSSDTSLNLMPTLCLFGPSFTILEGHISPGPGACAAWPSCLRVLCTCLRVPCLRLCFCQPACVDRYCVPARTCGACAGPLCANALHLFARAFSVPACVLCLTVFGKHCECIAQKCTHLERLPPLSSHLLLPSHCVLTRHGGKKMDHRNLCVISGIRTPNISDQDSRIRRLDQSNGRKQWNVPCPYVNAYLPKHQNFTTCC